MPLSLISPASAGGESRDKLGDWISKLKGEGVMVRGIMCVVVDDKRHLKNISSGETRLLQLNEVTAADHEKMAQRKAEGKFTAENAEMLSSEAKEWASNDGRPSEFVGPYVFDATVLQWAREELEAAAESRATCVVVDEAGPLELKKGRGLEPCLSGKILPMSAAGCAVVVVVRDNLREMLLAKVPAGSSIVEFPPDYSSSA